MIKYSSDFFVDRLVKEWLKHERLIIAVDLDDTIIPYNEEIKDNCKKMVNLILECQKEGIYFLINTARSKDQLQKGKEQVEALGIEVHGVNGMHPEWDRPYGINGKLYANIFLDDRGGFWDSYETLSNALTIVRKTRKNEKEQQL